MRRRFRMSPGGNHHHEPWFRIGSLEINTTMFVVLLSVVAFVVFAVEPMSKPIGNALSLNPWEVVHHLEFWRVVTWPFAYPVVSLWDVFSVVVFWYFGRDLESQVLGRVRWARLFGLMVVVLGLLSVAMYAVHPFNGYLSGLGTIGTMVFLLWIGEWPHRPFFFGIPGWLIGVIYVGIQVIQFVGYRMWWELLHFGLGLILVALIAKGFGLLSEISWIPKLRVRRRRKLKSVPPPVTNLPPRGSKWNPAPTPPVGRDEARMNELLDKILDSGQESLTAAERQELEELRLRRRRG